MDLAASRCDGRLEPIADALIKHSEIEYVDKPRRSESRGIRETTTSRGRFSLCPVARVKYEGDAAILPVRRGGIP